jgi:hypothetical protein
MMGRFRWLALWAGIGLAFSLGIGTPAHAEVTFNERIPTERVFANPCNGELVDVLGEQHLIVKTTEDGAGGLHISAFSSTHGEGVGNQGNIYWFSEQDEQQQNIQGTMDHFEFTFLVHFNVISQGSAPNFVSHALLHVTFANGEFKAFVTQFTEECRG